MQARRLRLTRHHRQLSTRCTVKPGTNNPMLMGPLRLQGLSQVDSSLESLAVIPGLDIRHCYFPVADLQLELAAIPVIHCSRFHFPASGAAAVINGLICYFPVWVPFRLRGKNVNSLFVCYPSYI